MPPLKTSLPRHSVRTIGSVFLLFHRLHNAGGADALPDGAFLWQSEDLPTLRIRGNAQFDGKICGSAHRFIRQNQLGGVQVVATILSSSPCAANVQFGTVAIQRPSPVRVGESGGPSAWRATKKEGQRTRKAPLPGLEISARTSRPSLHSNPTERFSRARSPRTSPPCQLSGITRIICLLV